MAPESLEHAMADVDNPVEMLRNSPVGSFTFPVLPDVHTNWIEEQRAWRESVALADQSFHMTGLTITGPGAVSLIARLDIGDYENFHPGDAKQFLPCNPDGATIGDGVLFYLDENELFVIGAPTTPNWVQYHAETGDEDVDIKRHGSALELEEQEDPTYFRYEVQGPDAIDVIEDVADEPLPDIAFFDFDTFSIAGHEVRGLRHSMSGEAGLEIWGPFEHADEIKRTIMEAGQPYGIRHLGTRAYRSSGPMSGWVEFQLPAIYTGEEMRSYREWLGADSPEAASSLGGSFQSDDITDYYMSPLELGHADRIDFDHDFIGRDALAEQIENQQRTKVSLFWDGDDVVDVYASLFRDGETHKYIDMPYPGWAVAHYDEVRADGEHVGISKWPAYNYNERTVISMASIDLEYTDPGTELTLTWGEPEAAERKPNVERHVETEIDVTVGPVPPAGDRR